MKKQYPLAATCVCQHANMWHKPDCRIQGCDCAVFERGTVKREGDASWMKKGRASHKIYRGSLSELRG